MLDRLKRPALHVADMPVDVQRRVAAIKRDIAPSTSSSSTVLGLYGMGGIGKTTLAKAVYIDLCSGFVDCCCFVEVGREAGRKQLQLLQERMLRELCGIMDRKFSSVDAGRAELATRLYGARVLLVIDDIWSREQRDALLVTVGQGSRVLLTTRDQSLLSRRNISQQPVDKLDDESALELFSWHAFMAKGPPTKYSGRAMKAVAACRGLPLTLTVIGAHLWSKESVTTWDQALRRLQEAAPFSGCSMEGDRDVWGRLLLSYDDLGSPEKRMFLDIACILLGARADRCLPVWGDLADSTLENLRNKSLVSLDSESRMAMHDQLRDMGRAIVNGEHTDHWRRSRVWSPVPEIAMSRMQVRKEIG